jgi:hypothetical protein
MRIGTARSIAVALAIKVFEFISLLTDRGKIFSLKI